MYYNAILTAGELAAGGGGGGPDLDAERDLGAVAGGGGGLTPSRCHTVGGVEGSLGLCSRHVVHAYRLPTCSCLRAIQTQSWWARPCEASQASASSQAPGMSRKGAHNEDSRHSTRARNGAPAKTCGADHGVLFCLSLCSSLRRVLRRDGHWALHPLAVRALCDPASAKQCDTHSLMQSAQLFHNVHPPQAEPTTGLGRKARRLVGMAEHGASCCTVGEQAHIHMLCVAPPMS
jgi:hypothetical protein